MDKRKIIDRLNSANIPMVFHDVQLKGVSHGDRFEAYLKGDDYKTDKTKGVGINVWGDMRVRAKLLPVLARAMCLLGEHVFLTQMVVVRDIAQNEEHTLNELLMNCDALLIQYFCAEQEPVPYTPAERANIEQMLLARAQRGKRNYFSSASPLIQSTWWSAEFLATHEAYTRDMQV